MDHRLNEFSKETCFVVVFNHKYTQNIAKLEQLYRGRFNDIFYLVPFYDGNEPNIISVYESSYRFQGFFAQSYKGLFHEKYSHYIFIADDLILNPRLNNTNIFKELKLKVNSGYIKQLMALSDVSFEWGHMAQTLDNLAWTAGKWYVDFRKELPDKAQAHELLRAHGAEVNPITWRNLKNRGGRYFYGYKRLLRAFDFMLRRYKDRSLAYPLAMSYADFIIVPSESYAKFCHFCGVLAAMNLFVEVAVPTAMALSCEHIVVEKDTAWRGCETWNADHLNHLPENERANFKHVLDSFEDHQLYLHPVKLSQWRSINSNE